MDRRERVLDHEETMRSSLDAHASQLWTALPGIIESVDLTKGTCVVQPAIKGQYRKPTGDWTSVNMPLLVDVPIVFPGGGGYTLTFPVKKGDECLVVFASRCIDAWWQSGGVQEAMENRRHDLSDGFAFVGPRSQANKIAPAPSGTTTTLRADDNTLMVELDKSGGVVNIKAPTKIKLDAPTVEMTGNATVAQTLTAQTDVVGGGIHLKTHTHSGVQSGGANTGAPVP